MERQESKLKVTGTINLGEFDPLAERDRALKELDLLRDKIEEVRRVHEEEVKELRDLLHRKELEIIRLGLQIQIDSLAQMIKASTQTLSFQEQYEQFLKMAKQLGYYPA